jgi:PhnB protein
MAFGPNPPPIQVHLCVKGGEVAIAFYENAFNGTCTFKKMTDDGKRLMHANVDMFGGEVMLHDDFPEHVDGDVTAPTDGSRAHLTININLPKSTDVDAVMTRAADAGATITMRPDDMFWGSRYGRVRDPFGHIWAFNAPLKPA